jgi:hypothetical protein
MSDIQRHYDIRIRVVTSDTPTDLELGDLCLQLCSCLESPVVEFADGSLVNADYEFDGWRLELFEDSGERVWMYATNAELISDPIDQSPSTPTGLRERVRRLASEVLSEIQIVVGWTRGL